MDVVAIVEKLNELGLIRTSRIIGNYYQCYCPIHNDGNEKKPSFGILLRDETRNGQHYPAGWSHCFSCQLAKSLPDLITEILKIHNINDRSGLDWLKENIPGFEESEFDYLLPRELVQTINAQYMVDYINTLVGKKETYIEEEELKKYRFTIDYMYERNLTDEVIAKFDVGVDMEFVPEGRKNPIPCITFPVKDIDGNVLFIYRRSLANKQFYMPSGLEKPVYGLYELDKNCKSVILCESIFNALTCYSYGYPALALFGTGTPYQINQLKRLGVREFILGLDPDEAGARGASKLRRNLQNVAMVTRMYDIPPGRDINDLTKEEFDYVLSRKY